MPRSAIDHSASETKARASLGEDRRLAPPSQAAPEDIRSLTLAELAELPRRLERLEAAVAELLERFERVAAGPTALLTVRQFCERYGWSENQLRWLLFNREKNGLSAAVSGSGRLLIDVAYFFEILKRDKSVRRRVRRLR